MNMAPAFRNLERATDAARMREIFASHSARLDRHAADVEACHVPRVFPLGDAFVVQYELWLRRRGHSESTRLVLCGLVDTGGDGLALAADSGYDANRCIALPEIGLVAPIFPYDPGLPALAAIWDDDRTHRLLNRYATVTGGADPKGTLLSRTVLGYRLGRRCTLALAEHSPGLDRPLREIVVRIVPPRKAVRFTGTLTRLAEAGLSGTSHDGLTVPALLGADTAAGVIAMERAPGESLHELAGTAGFLPAAAAAGRMLRRLHDLEGLDGEDRRHTAATEAADLASRTDRICTIFPHGASLLSEVSDLLGARAASGLESATARPVHRDFYDKQVLYTAGRTTLLDLDNLASGDPAQDVGNFLAHLELRRLQHSELEPGLARAADAFLDAYGNVDPDLRERVGWWQAATLLRLAGLYALRPRWHHLTLDLAKLARQHLDAATPVFITDKEVV